MKTRIIILISAVAIATLSFTFAAQNNTNGAAAKEVATNPSPDSERAPVGGLLDADAL